MPTEPLHLPGSNAEEAVEMESYEENFPPIQTQDNAKNWGPVQATRMSARVAGDARTILQKAQQFKSAQDARTTREGISKPFSLFNNPSFLSVANKVGIDVILKEKIDADPSNNVADRCREGRVIPDSTEGSAADFITPRKMPSDVSVESSNSELWYLVCKNRRGKHPRTRLVT